MKMALPKLNTPKYELTIPSTGKSIEYRPYLVREEKLLMIALESADEMQMVSAIKQIVAACTFDIVDVNRLAMFDVEYIFAKLRAKSVGETAKVSLDCDKCEAKNNVTINIEDDINVTEQADPKIVLTDNMGLIMKYPSMSSFLDVQNSENTEVDKLFDLIAMSIESIYEGEEIHDGDSHSTKDKVEFIDSLSGDQFQEVQKWMNNLPQAYVKVQYTCIECKHEHDIELKGLKNFFG
jgi:hypothetical protein